MSLRVAVIDYQGGNLASAARSLKAAAVHRQIEADVLITSHPEEVVQADKIVLPGQGSFADCAAGLSSVDGLKSALLESVTRGTPFLGICVGMQLMAEQGLEHEVTPGFGWIQGKVAKMDVGSNRLPHMGWNELCFEPGSHKLLENIRPGDHAYFVHSYAYKGCRPEEIIATANYVDKVVAIVAKANVAGTQFHAEKSQQVGLKILGNFLSWSP